MFSPNVTEFANNETLAMLAYKTNPVEVESFCICNCMGPGAIKDKFHEYFQSFHKIALVAKRRGQFGKL